MVVVPRQITQHLFQSRLPRDVGQVAEMFRSLSVIQYRVHAFTNSCLCLITSQPKQRNWPVPSSKESGTNFDRFWPVANLTCSAGRPPLPVHDADPLRPARPRRGDPAETRRTTYMPERLDEEELADWRAGRNAAISSPPSQSARAWPLPPVVSRRNRRRRQGRQYAGFAFLNRPPRL